MTTLPARTQIPASTHRGRPPTEGLRETILQTATAIFTDSDYHEVLMDDVARRAHVSKGTLYRYFPNKRGLYLAVMFDGITRLQEDVARALAAPNTPLRKIERIVQCILAHFWDRRFFFALIHRNEHKPDDADSREWMDRRAELAAVIQHAIKEAIKAGELRAIDPRIATELLLGMLRGVNRYRSKNDSLDHMVAAVLDVFLHGTSASSSKRGLRKTA